MSGVPDDPTCSICTRLRTAPPKDAIRVLTEVRSAWCNLHRRQLPAPDQDPSISFLACSQFESVYRTDVPTASKPVGTPYPPPPPTHGDDEWLWELKVDAPQYGVYERYRKLSELPEVDRGHKGDSA